MPDPKDGQAAGVALWSAVTVLLNIVPPRIRARTVALYYMAISLSGLMLGPSLVGLLNDWVFGVEGARYSLALVSAIFGLPVLALAPITMRLYHRALDAGLGEG